MKVIIQSFSDIITNSSSEVFVSAKNDELINLLKEWNIDYNCYETEEELRKAVEESPWDFNKITTFNPYQEYWFMEDLWRVKGKDIVWEFFKDLYTELLGKIIVDVDRDYLYGKCEESNKYIFDYVKQ